MQWSIFAFKVLGDKMNYRSVSDPIENFCECLITFRTDNDILGFYA